MATWRSGYAAVCKTVYPGSIPGVASSLRCSAAPARQALIRGCRAVALAKAGVTGFIGASCFQSRRGFVIGNRAYAEWPSSFPGSSAVEQPAVNRLVAGSKSGPGSQTFSNSRHRPRRPRAPRPGLLGPISTGTRNPLAFAPTSGLRATMPTPHRRPPRPPHPPVTPPGPRPAAAGV